MRKGLFFIVALFMVACTVTEQDRAEDLIRQYLDRNANDPHRVVTLATTTAATPAVAATKAGWSRSRQTSQSTSRDIRRGCISFSLNTNYTNYTNEDT